MSEACRMGGHISCDPRLVAYNEQTRKAVVFLCACACHTKPEED